PLIAWTARHSCGRARIRPGGSVAPSWVTRRRLDIWRSGSEPMARGHSAVEEQMLGSRREWLQPSTAALCGQGKCGAVRCGPVGSDPGTGGESAETDSIVSNQVGGVPERTRTSGLQVRNLMLYPLSYGHTPWALAERE